MVREDEDDIGDISNILKMERAGLCVNCRYLVRKGQMKGRCRKNNTYMINANDGCWEFMEKEQ